MRKEKEKEETSNTGAIAIYCRVCVCTVGLPAANSGRAAEVTDAGHAGSSLHQPAHQALSRNLAPPTAVGPSGTSG